MKKIYNNLDIHFTIPYASCTVVNLAKERFSAPIPEHYHGTDSFELHYISDGYGIVKVNGTTYQLDPDSFYLTGPYVRHEQIPHSSNPMTEYCVYFKYKNLSPKSVFSSFWSDYPFEIRHDMQPVFHILKQVFAELENQEFGYLSKISALFQESFIELIRRYYKHTPISSPHSVSRTSDEGKTFLIEKTFLYEYKDLTLDKLSKILGLSQRQTIRLLKKYYNKTFSEKRTDARMSAATVLFKNRSLTLLEISEKLGYSSLEYFITQFKKYYKMTPQEYIKKNHL